MSGAKDILKGGWHPKGKDGGKESWRGDNKGIDTIAGWMGKSRKDTHAEAAREHRSAPLSSLKDPDSFGPPPKRTTGGGAGGGASAGGLTLSSGGLGSGLSQQQIREQRQREEEEERLAREEAERPAPPPVPYRVDTTGLSTENLPTPPVRRAGGPVLPPPFTTSSPAKPKPGLPPRLPARAVAPPPPIIPSTAPPAYESAAGQKATSTPFINQSAANRLGKAGISVPGFGIGRTTASPPPPPRGNNSTPPPSSATAPPASQLSELQSRFSKFSTSSSTPSPTSAPAAANGAAAGGGTTWAQKRAALQTAQNFHKDPSSVSLSDARAAASTANDFRARHGEQVAQGLQKANGINERYGVLDRVNGAAGSAGSASGGGGAGSGGGAGLGALAGLAGKKPAPPPPPKKRAELRDLEVDGAGGAPPPLPMDSKPRFGG